MPDIIARPGLLWVTGRHWAPASTEQLVDAGYLKIRCRQWLHCQHCCFVSRPQQRSLFNGSLAL